jgi:hypothetical protein
MGTKLNPGKYDCLHKAHQDEPYFVILARDPLSYTIVSLWAKLRRIMAPKDTDKCLEAERIAVDMMRWRKVNPDKIKTADMLLLGIGIASPVSPGEATQTPRSGREATTERSDPSIVCQIPPEGEYGEGGVS